MISQLEIQELVKDIENEMTEFFEEEYLDVEDKLIEIATKHTERWGEEHPGVELSDVLSILSVEIDLDVIEMAYQDAQYLYKFGINDYLGL